MLLDAPPATTELSAQIQKRPFAIDKNDLPAWRETFSTDRQTAIAPLANINFPSKIGHKRPVNQSQRQLDLPNKPTIQSINIPRSQSEKNSDAKPLCWINVCHPTPEVLNRLSKKFNINLRQLETCLASNNFPYYFRNKDCLIVSISELTLKKFAQVPKVIANPICAVLGNDFLITLTNGPSTAITRVLKEIKAGSIDPEKIASANHVFSRMLGSSLHVAESIVNSLSTTVENFYNRHAKSEATANLHGKLVAMERCLTAASKASSTTPQLIAALSEEDNLFGADRPRDSLNRYKLMIERAISTINAAQDTLKNIRESWRITQERWQNDMLYKLTMLTGSIALPTTFASIFSISFVQDYFAASTIWAGLGFATLASAVLVGWLFRKRHLLSHE